MNRQLNRHLKHDVKLMIMYQGTKLSTVFQMNDQAKFEHWNDLLYYVVYRKWLRRKLNKKNDKRISERIIDQNKRGRK